MRSSIERSLRRLRTDVLDIVFIHSNGDDLRILADTDAVSVLLEFKSRGLVRGIGLSGKTVEGARKSLEWADVLMVEYHVNDTSHAEVIDEAARRSVGIVVKKGLASGRLPAEEAIGFVLKNRSVNSLVVGGLNIAHLQANIAAARGANCQ